MKNNLPSQVFKFQTHIFFSTANKKCTRKMSYPHTLQHRKLFTTETRKFRHVVASADKLNYRLITTPTQRNGSFIFSIYIFELLKTAHLPQ